MVGRGLYTITTPIKAPNARASTKDQFNTLHDEI